MKIVIDIPNEAYELLKNKQVLDNIAESIIANGIPYEDKIEEVIDLLETEWGYEGIREDVEKIMKGEEE